MLSTQSDAGVCERPEPTVDQIKFLVYFKIR